MNHILEKTIYGETMKNKITGILLIVILVFANLNVVLYAKETPDELKNLYAQSAVLMDADSGRILFGKEEDEVLPMASTTKIMTCILALELGNPNDIVKISRYAVSVNRNVLLEKTNILTTWAICTEKMLKKY